jgi:hypothetical protein
MAQRPMAPTSLNSGRPRARRWRSRFPHPVCGDPALPRADAVWAVCAGCSVRNFRAPVAERQRSESTMKVFANLPGDINNINAYKNDNSRYGQQEKSPEECSKHCLADAAPPEFFMINCGP